MDAISDKAKYFSQIDGFRFIAILAVMECHWVLVFTPETGFAGVNLFYVISGFLITRILLISKDENKGIRVSFKRFYIRRTLRIFPIYYLCVFLLLIFNIPGARHEATYLLTYTYNYKMALINPYIDGNKWGSYPHFWSLCVEEQFYMIFPIFIFLIPKKKLKKFFFIVIGIGVLTRFLLMFQSNMTIELDILPSCLDSFRLGALLGYYILYDLDFLKKILLNKSMFLRCIMAWAVFEVCYYSFLSVYSPVYCFLDRFLFSLCCFWIVGKAALGMYRGIMKKILENRIVIYLGKISYGMYMYHLFVGEFFDSTNNLYMVYRKCPSFLKYFWRAVIKYSPIYGEYNLYKLFVYSVITVIVASVSWYLIEKPIISLKEKFAK